jgi:hypothetical protein
VTVAAVAAVVVAGLRVAVEVETLSGERCNTEAHHYGDGGRSTSVVKELVIASLGCYM